MSSGMLMFLQCPFALCNICTSPCPGELELLKWGGGSHRNWAGERQNQTSTTELRLTYTPVEVWWAEYSLLLQERKSGGRVDAGWWGQIWCTHEAMLDAACWTRYARIPPWQCTQKYLKDAMANTWQKGHGIQRLGFLVIRGSATQSRSARVMCHVGANLSESYSRSPALRVSKPPRSLAPMASYQPGVLQNNMARGSAPVRTTYDDLKRSAPNQGFFFFNLRVFIKE